MEALVKQHYLDFYAAGGDVASFYDGPYDIWSPAYGIWPVAELSQKANPALSPKFRGLLDVAAASPVTATPGIPVSGVSATSLSVNQDTFGASFRTGYAGSSLFWSLKVPTAGTYDINLTTLGSPNTAYGLDPGTVQVYSDSQHYLGTYSVGRSGTFSLGSVALAAGRTTLSIHVVHGYYDPTDPNLVRYYFAPSALTLTPETPATGQSSGPAIGDPGFESVVLADGTFQYSPTGSTWSFGAGSGLSANNSGFTGYNPVSPQGRQVAFLQMGGALSETVPGWTAGVYVVKFQAAQRTGNRQNLQVLVDGTVVGMVNPSGSTYQAYSSAAFAVSAGPHSITFQGLDSSGGDNSAFIDDVKVAPAPGAAPVIGDSGFETISQAAGSFLYQPNGSAWTFAAGSGVSGNGSGFTGYNPASPEGQQVAFLQMGSWFSQVVSGWTAGAYVLNFQAAQRAGNHQDFQVLIDGVSVGAFRPGGTAYPAYSTSTFTVSTGAHTDHLPGPGQPWGR